MLDPESGSDDDEYGPVVATWGSQPKQQEDNNGVSVAQAWASLKDPNAKIGPDGIGSGGLHRLGNNYRPIDEEDIVRQRKSKGQPQPKKLGPAVDKKPFHKTKRHTSFPTPAPPPHHSQRHPNHSNYSNHEHHRPQQKQKKQQPYEPSQVRRRPLPPSQNASSETTSQEPPRRIPPKNSSNPWNSGTLVDTPFWESGQGKPEVPQPSASPPAATTRQPYPPETPHPYPRRPLPQQYQHQGQRPPSESQQRLPPGLSSAPTTRRPSVPPGLFQRAIHDIQPDQDRIKYNKPPGLSPIPFQGHAPAAPETRPAAAHTFGAPPPGTPPSSIPPNKVPNNPVLITINIELENGISVPVSIRLHDDPSVLADQFIRNFNLTNPSIISGLHDMFHKQKRIVLVKHQQKRVTHQ
ncbi:hypothetical protein BCR43DRAFT_483796 [Syncephalastrum racemosum]|uniref:Uncharacterized protein n=1 Tax=Syncephalastrum racemosum TaxID=13706 RepID=A0A1X2HVZ9_SYNRA|nr:hypothetical protein BCR43DRAFT_483796 [Syncephalastrum racemosum]